MSLAWLFPAGFAALAALLLPLLIHLARRDQQVPLDFAALRWLRAAPRPRRRIRFDERLLLLVRLLLLAAVAALLARPVLHGADDRRPVVAVLSGIPAREAERQPRPDDARLLWLAAGFPPLDAPTDAHQPTSSLLRELDAQVPPGVPLVVLVPPVFDGADGLRPRLSRAIEWRVIDGVEPPAAGTRSAPPAPRLRLSPGDDRLPGARYLRAAQAAWPSAKDYDDVLVQLRSGPLLPEAHRHLDAGGTLLLGTGVEVPASLAWSSAWRDEAGLPVLEAATSGRGRLLRFTRALEPRAFPALLEAAFPEHLREALTPAPPAPSRVDARAYRPGLGERALPPAPRELQPWLVLAITLLFALERLLATRRARGAAS